MGVSQSKDFDTSKLNSFWTVIGLSHDPIHTFVVTLELCPEMWYHVFLWSLFSSIIIHILASSIAFGSLRRHKSLRFGPILVLMAGIVTPLTAYSITSAAVAGVHRAASFQMYPLYAMFWGCGQTLVTLVFSFTRVLATL
ncbi:unnamed protein product, partial [Medioppia subpectinata]